MEIKKEPSTTLIYVSNLPFDTTDEQFKQLFIGFSIKTAYVAKRKNGKSKGFGFVNFEKESEQKLAIEKINGKELNSRKLNAKIAYNDERRNENGELKEEFISQIEKNNTPITSETVVHVSNLEWSVTDEGLKLIFKEFNPKVATVATRRNGRSKGFGFVEFNTKEEQQNALKLNGTTISNRAITVQVSVTSQRPRRPTNRNTNNNRNNNNRSNNNNNRRNDNNRNTNRGGNTKQFTVVRRNTGNDRRNERRSENTLYISNLPFELDDNDLKQIFQEFNPKNAHIPLRRNGKSKGFGFVEFGNSKDQNEALRALDQSEVNGRVVTIKISTPSNNNNSRVTVRRNNNFRSNNNVRRNDNRRNDNRNNNSNNRPPRRNDNRSINRSNENREVSTNMIYVSNLPFSVDDKSLEGIFKGLKISRAYVSKRRNGNSKGYGFVEFSTPEDQQKAINQNGSEVQGRSIVVQAAFKVEAKTN